LKETVSKNGLALNMVENVNPILNINEKGPHTLETRRKDQEDQIFKRYPKQPAKILLIYCYIIRCKGINLK
jgi:hypothetical protein